MPRTPILLIGLALLVAGCTGSEDLDTDRDGIEDADEAQGVDIDIETAAGTERRHVTSDTGNRDTDGDGLLDGDEMLVRGSDPRDVDTDGDGLLDGHDIPSPPEDVATTWRARGILELNRTFLGELDQCPPGTPQLRPNRYSSDLPLPDGLSDGDELRGWDIIVKGTTRHVTSDPCRADADEDGLADEDERALAVDPRDPDTDRDGVVDGQDAAPLHDLSLRFGPIEVQRTNGTGAVRLVLQSGIQEAALNWPGNDTTILEVSDSSSSRESLQVPVILSAQDLQTGETLALFSDPRGQIVEFDLLRERATGVEPHTGDPRLLRFAGADGTITIAWAVDRT